MSCVHKGEDSSCPFACTMKSEEAQGFGCLPTRYDIMVMRIVHGKTWACHENPNKPCAGAMRYLKENNMPYKVIDKNLLSDTPDCHWEQFCEGKLPKHEYV